MPTKYKNIGYHCDNCKKTRHTDLYFEVLGRNDEGIFCSVILLCLTCEHTQSVYIKLVNKLEKSPNQDSIITLLPFDTYNGKNNIVHYCDQCEKYNVIHLYFEFISVVGSILCFSVTAKCLTCAAETTMYIKAGNNED